MFNSWFKIARLEQENKRLQKIINNRRDQLSHVSRLLGRELQKGTLMRRQFQREMDNERTERLELAERLDAANKQTEQEKDEARRLRNLLRNIILQARQGWSGGVFPAVAPPPEREGKEIFFSTEHEPAIDVAWRDLTPEHSKRNMPGGLHPEIEAAYAYVETVLDTADLSSPVRAWHGWALREAFLAGCSTAQACQEDQANG